MKSHEEEPQHFSCEICKQNFTRQDNLSHHLKVHSNPKYSCRECEEKFSSKYNLMHHQKTHHVQTKPLVSVKKSRPSSSSTIRTREQLDSLNVFRSIVLEPEDDTRFDLTIFFNSIRNELQVYLEREMEEKILSSGIW